MTTTMARPTCGAPTTRGWPCRITATRADGRCGRHAATDALAARACDTCRRTKPPRLFRRTGVGIAWTCRDCDERARRSAGTPVRHRRRNARGQAWCNACPNPDGSTGRYREPEAFKPHPSRPGTLWTYCRDCTRQYDRDRRRARTADPERRAADNRRRARGKRVQRAADLLSRRRFFRNAALTLLDRGLTRTEICRLGRFNRAAFENWLVDRGRYRRRSEEALTALLMATSHLPVGNPQPRRRNPHPDYRAIAAAMGVAP